VPSVVDTIAVGRIPSGVTVSGTRRELYVSHRIDADLTIVDLGAEDTIDPARLHSKSRATPFAGMRVKGLPVYTIVRGRVVMQRGELAAPAYGEFVRP